MFDLQEGRFQGQSVDPFRLMPVFWLLASSPGTPSSPPTPSPETEDMDGHQLDRHMPIPFYLPPPTPAPKQPLYRMFHSSRCVGGL